MKKGVRDYLVLVSPEKVKSLFDLVEGEWWEQEQSVNNPDNLNTISETREDNEYNNNNINKKKCRDARLCFKDGQLIRHTGSCNNTWIGKYDYTNNAIICNGNIYKSNNKGKAPLNNFTLKHYESVNKGYRKASSWWECECKINNNWVSTDDLPIININNQH